MSKVVRFPVTEPVRFGSEKVRRKKRVDLEDYGQLTLFQDHKIINLPSINQPFEQALVLESSNPKESIEWYKKSIKSGLFVADSYCNLGILYFESGQIQEALLHFAKALSLQPSHAVTHFNLANLYSDQGSLQLAQFHYEAAVNFKPDFLAAYYNLSINSLALDRPLDALEYLTKFIECAGPEADPTITQHLHQLIQQNFSQL